jgi:hypothetical protein
MSIDEEIRTYIGAAITSFYSSGFEVHNQELGILISFFLSHDTLETDS